MPVNFTVPSNQPISNCLMIGLNGGTGGASHPVTSASNLGLRYTSAPSEVSMIGANGEFCFGQSTGCQLATTNNALSFAVVRPISQSGRITALFGNISDSTFDGTSKFGPPPTGPWTATNDFYIYHAAACAAVGAVSSGIAGPGNFYAQVPADAIHLLSVPVSGNGIGASHAPVFQLLSTPVTAGDCLVTLFGMQGSGAFDNETQVFALIQ
jgi:hypothetical protein